MHLAGVFRTPRSGDASRPGVSVAPYPAIRRSIETE